MMEKGERLILLRDLNAFSGYVRDIPRAVACLDQDHMGWVEKDHAHVLIERFSHPTHPSQLERHCGILLQWEALE